LPGFKLSHPAACGMAFFINLEAAIVKIRTYLLMDLNKTVYERTVMNYQSRIFDFLYYQAGKFPKADMLCGK